MVVWISGSELLTRCASCQFVWNLPQTAVHHFRGTAIQAAASLGNLPDKLYVQHNFTIRLAPHLDTNGRFQNRTNGMVKKRDLAIAGRRW